MQSLQPDPAARYKNVMDALHRIVATEGVWRPMRGLNATAVGAGPAHALYFACYEKLKKTLSDVIHPGANSHLANGTTKHAYAHITQMHRQTGVWRSFSLTDTWAQLQSSNMYVFCLRSCRLSLTWI